MYTKTTNGQTALSEKKYLESAETALAGFNYSLCKKDDFENSKKFLTRIFQSNDLEAKTLAIALIFHTRDIENGKGLRLPFTESLIYLNKLGYSDLVCELLQYIPKFGYFKDLCKLYSFFKQNFFNNQQILDKLLQIYAAKLNEENKTENSNQLNNCAKYAPRERKKYHIFAQDLAKHMFPESSTPDKNYRQLVTSILKKYKQITEILMSQKKWDEIDPKYVPSICFQRYKNVFLNSKEIDDEKRKALKLKYEEHIKNAAEKKDGAKINAKRLFIDTIVEEAVKLNQYDSTEIQQQTINAQMIDIVEDVKKSGTFLKKVCAVCDVSGSMSGNPMNACIGLGLIINEINQLEDYQNNLITFDYNPQFIKLQKNDSYFKRIHQIKKAPWGGSTNFFKTMKLIAQQAGSAEGLPDAVFVFSDMQFNQANGNYSYKRYNQNRNRNQNNNGNTFSSDSSDIETDDEPEQDPQWTTTYKEIEKIFQKNKLPIEKIPVIIFWNLRSSNEVQNFVVDSKQKGVICISGYSQNLMKQILKCQNIEQLKKIDPYQFLVETLQSERYEPIRNVAEKFFKQQQEDNVAAMNQ